jgi:hypothetical protein
MVSGYFYVKRYALGFNRRKKYKRLILFITVHMAPWRMVFTVLISPNIKTGQTLYLINHQDNIGADSKSGSMIDVFALPILGGFGHFINKNTC